MNFEMHNDGYKDLIKVNDAHIIYTNFAGRVDDFNKNGDRTFNLVIPSSDIADELINSGWNVKIKAPRNEGDEPFMTLKVKVRYNEQYTNLNPKIYLESGNNRTRINEETIGMLDDIDIQECDLVIRSYDYDNSFGKGRAAYLDQAYIVQQLDAFEERFLAGNEEVPF